MITFPTKCEGVLKLADVELREWPLEAARTSDSIDAANFKLHENSANFAYDVQKQDLRSVLMMSSIKFTLNCCKAKLEICQTFVLKLCVK